MIETLFETFKTLDKEKQKNIYEEIIHNKGEVIYKLSLPVNLYSILDYDMEYMHKRRQYVEKEINKIVQYYEHTNSL